MLIQNGADVNAAELRIQTALHGAALNGHVEIVKALLQNGANVNDATFGKQTPLHLARRMDM